MMTNPFTTILSPASRFGRACRWAAAAFLFLSAVGCTDEEHSERVLRQAGYRDIEMTGYRFTGCGEHDRIHDGFSARGPQGDHVEGVVCCGWGPLTKSCTIRLD